MLVLGSGDKTVDWDRQERGMGEDPTRRAAIFDLGWRSVLASGFRLQIRHFNPEFYCQQRQNVEGTKKIVMSGNDIISRSCLSFIQDFNQYACDRFAISLLN